MPPKRQPSTAASRPANGPKRRRIGNAGEPGTRVLSHVEIPAIVGTTSAASATTATAVSNAASTAASTAPSTVSSTPATRPEPSDETKASFKRDMLQPGRDFATLRARQDPHESDWESDDEIIKPRQYKKVDEGEAAQGKHPGVDLSLPPLSNIEEIFVDIAREAHGRQFKGGDRPIRVATACSGTEAPLLALKMISEGLRQKGIILEIEHVFSAEIEPFKQAYIERNFAPPIIFRDITEWSRLRAQFDAGKSVDKADLMATTAYGGKVAVPQHIDVFVAGCSCVDYSNLNNERAAKQDLEADGESRATFFAVRDFAALWQPKVMVLENVKNAPWKMMQQLLLDVGYDTHVTIVDTKDYYLPQTRERGYMVCLRRTDNIYTLAAVRQWELNMVNFRRAPSSPATSFLLSANDTRLRGLKAGRGRNIKAEPSWEMCRVRHADARNDECLGKARPFTNWSEAGACIGPDYGSHKWLKGQPERVKDLLDCTLLRKAKLPGLTTYDPRFKTRVWEVSQNIHMFHDSPAFGIAPCQTPSGIPYVTDRGGPLSGYDTLSLQGIPVDSITFTTETNRDLQNLAGNAMSTTVVGCAILSALMVASPMLNLGITQETDPRLDKHPLPSLTHGEGEGYLFYGDHLPRHDQLELAGDSQPINLNKLMKTAELTARKCYCEGHTAVSKKGIQVCKACGHTTCINCGGNAPHEYELREMERRNPEVAQDEWRELFPASVRFEGAQMTNGAQSQLTTLGDYTKALHGVISQAFRLRDIKRDFAWRICYETELARLELVLGERPQWVLFVKPDAKLPGDHPLRIAFEDPVARGYPRKRDVFEIDWEVFELAGTDFAMTITGGGGKIPSWLNELGLTEFTDQVIDEELNIEAQLSHIRVENVSGKYVALPKCGMAGRSLYRRAPNAEDRQNGPMFLFLDPTRVGPPELDCFVFSREHHRLEYDESRDVIARVSHDWRPLAVNYDPEDLSDDPEDLSDDPEDLSDEPERIQSSGRVNGRWNRVHNLQLERVSQSVRIETLSTSLAGQVAAITSGACYSLATMLRCTFMLPSDIAPRWQDSQRIEPTNAKFFSDFAWLVGRVKSLPQASTYCDLMRFDSAVPCRHCTPEWPPLRWRLKKANKAEDSQTSGNASAAPAAPANTEPALNKVKPYEDPQAAASFERNQKARPTMFSIEYFIDKELHTKQGVAIRCGVNFISMAHRAAAPLQALSATVQTSWRFVTDYSPVASPRLPRFIIEGNDDDAPFEGDLGWNMENGNPLTLFDEQKKSLTWMKAREAIDAKPFNLEEVEEAIFTPMGWVAEVRAQCEASIRGGIVADRVSFGKTVTTLALIHSEFQDKDEQRILSSFSGKDSSELMRAQATLIVCPRGLTQQWLGEIKKFLPAKDYEEDSDVLVVETLQHLAELRVSDIKRAKIIVVSFGIFKDCLSTKTKKSYATTLATFAGTLEPDSTAMKNRSFSSWLNYASGRIKNNLGVLLENGVDFFWEEVGFQTRSAVEDEAFHAAVPSKRLRGRKFVEERLKGLGSEILKSTPQPSNTVRKHTKLCKKDSDSYKGGPLLHLFKFNRLVVDEFTYLDGAEYQLVRTLKADKRWILSGTPKLSDFLDVQRMAALIGVYLGVENDAPGVLTEKNTQRLQEELTESEQFHAFRDMKSARWHERRHTHAQTFLREFARQNDSRVDGIVECDENFKPVLLNAEHFAIYMELTQHLSLKNMSTEKINKHTAGERENKINLLMNDVSSGEEALINCAAYYKSRPAEAPSDELVKIRDEELDNHLRDTIGVLEQAQYLDDSIGLGKSKFEAWKNRMCNDGSTVTDFEAALVILAAVQDVKERKGTLPPVTLDEVHTKKQGGKFTQSGGGQSPTIATINGLCNSLTACSLGYMRRIRGVRYLRAMHTLQNAVQTGRWSKDALCQSLACPRPPPTSSSINVLAECGHRACTTCLKNRKQKFTCVDQDCGATILDATIIKASYLAEGSSTVQHPSFGAKLEAITDLLATIPPAEQAILFCQNLHLVQHAAEAFDAHGISYYAIDGGKQGAVDIEAFKTETDLEQRKKVLILNLTSESAAGLNLTNANHIIFFSPLLVNSRDEYLATMTQAIGRTRRIGQKNRVHIYKFAALRTIDVDVLEHRERRSTTLVTGIPQMFVPFHRFDQSTTTDRMDQCAVVKTRDGKMALMPLNLMPPRSEDESRGYSSLVKFSRKFTEDEDDLE